MAELPKRAPETPRPLTDHERDVMLFLIFRHPTTVMHVDYVTEAAVYFANAVDYPGGKLVLEQLKKAGLVEVEDGAVSATLEGALNYAAIKGSLMVD